MIGFGTQTIGAVPLSNEGLGDYMSWLENLKEVKKQRGVTVKWIVEHSGVPEKTVEGVFSGKVGMPRTNTLSPICNALGVSLEDILADTGAVIGNKTLAVLQSEVDLLTAEVERLNGELVEAAAENTVLRDRVLTAENALKATKLALQEEIIALHRHYIEKERKQV